MNGAKTQTQLQQVQTTNDKTTTQFIARVVPWPLKGEPGFINVHWHLRGKGFHGRGVRSVEEFFKVANDHTGWNLYFCLSCQAIAGERDTEHALAFKAIWLDIDIKLKGYSTFEELFDALFDFIKDYNLPPPSAIVFTGNGLHVYWISNRVLSVEEWRRFAEGLKAAAVNWGLKCDAGCTADAARVLRIPGTRNFKTSPPVRGKLVHLQDKDLDFTTDLKMLPDLAPARKSNGGVTDKIEIADAFKHLDPNENLGQGIEIKDAGPLSLEPILDGCGWLREAHDTGGKEYDQPQWNLTTLCSVFLENGYDLAHRFGNRHPGYIKEKTDELWARKNREHEESDVGWPSCEECAFAISRPGSHLSPWSVRMPSWRLLQGALGSSSRRGFINGC
jgi:hypothetical protein